MAHTRRLKESKTEIGNRIDGLLFDQEDQEASLEMQHGEIQECHDKIELLTNMMVKYEDTLDQLTGKVSSLEAKNLNAELIIFGLTTDEEEESCVTIATNFFKHQMGIKDEIKISNAYWKGKGGDKPMVIQIDQASSKGTIYSNVANLKGKTNKKEQSYRIEDHLPELLAEQQCRYRQILVANNKQSEGNRQKLKISKDKLMIANKPYHSKVSTSSSNKAMLTMDADTLSNAKELKAAGGDSDTENGSRFVAYACGANKIEEVRKVYIHYKR